MELLELGIAAARAGNRQEARMYLEAATFAKPDNEQAFLWLSFVLDDRKLAMRCLERVLSINPQNEQAKRGLTWLQSQGAAQGVPLPRRLTDAEMSALLGALNHPDEQVAVKAIRQLGEAGDARAVDRLLHLLVVGKSKTIQAQARAALIAIGTASVEPALNRLMRETDLSVASQLAAVLARVHSMAALAACREVVEKAPHPATRYAMVVNLTASSHGEAALGIIRDYVADAQQDERARAAVVTALGQGIKSKTLNADQGLSTLSGMAADLCLSWLLRQAALLALGISNQPFAVRQILSALSDKDERVRLAAVDALCKFTPPQTSLLDKLAHSADKAVRTRANQILTSLASDRRSTA